MYAVCDDRASCRINVWRCWNVSEMLKSSGNRGRTNEEGSIYIEHVEHSVVEQLKHANYDSLMPLNHTRF